MSAAKRILGGLPNKPAKLERIQELPTSLHCDKDPYTMILNENDGTYSTSRPRTTVGKIGNSYPPKIKYTFEQLLEMGYKI